MRWIMVLVAVGIASCARGRNAPGNPGPSHPTPGGSAPGNGLVNYFDVVSTPADGDGVRRARDSAFHAVNAAGTRLATIAVEPRLLEIHAGEDLDLMRALKLVGRDSAGRVVNGWSPYFQSSDMYFARTDELVLMAFAPGTLYVAVQPVVRRDSLRGIFPAVPGAMGETKVIIRPRVYAAPATGIPSAREVLEAYTSALGAEQWADAARHVYEPGFAHYVNTRIAAFKPPPFPEMTLEQYLAAFERRPNPPAREVLVRQYEARQRARSTRPDESIEEEFREVTTVAQLAALPTSDVIARWLETTDPRTHARLDALGRCDPIATRRAVAMATTHLRVVGVVPMNDSLAWGVVTPIGFPTQPRVTHRTSSTLAMRRVASGAWKVDLRPETRGFMTVGNPCPVVNR